MVLKSTSNSSHAQRVIAAIAGFLCVLTGFLASAIGQDTAVPSKSDQPKSASFQPLGAPDYAKMTGFIEHANLPLEQPEVLWKTTSEVQRNGQFVARPLTNAVVADGVLYFGDDSGGLVAYEIKSASELWTHAHGSRISATPSVDRDFVYFGSPNGVTALGRKDGQVAWHYQIEHGASEATPIPIGDRLYLSGYDGHAYCLDRKSGEVQWKHDFISDAPEDPPDFPGARARFQQILARPNGSASNGELFIQSVFDQSRVVAIDCQTGKRKWSFQAKGWIGPAPTIAGERVFVVSQDKNLYCLDLSNGKVKWQYTTPSWLASQVAVYDGQVYLPHHRSRLFQLNAETGQLIRIMEPPDEKLRDGAVYSFPIIANKTAYFACGNGWLFAFDIETGNLRWQLQPSEHSELFTNPVTDGRHIFVTSRRNLQKAGEDAIFVIGIEP
jgi:outer membrane protein assembly factor BamB